MNTLKSCLLTSGLSTALALVIPHLAYAQTAPQAPDSENDAIVVLSPFEVNAANDVGYGSTHSIGGSRISVPTREIPNYTVTLNEEFLRDIAAVELLDGLEYVSGVAISGGGQADTQYSLRGYAQAGIAYRDGIPDREHSTDISPNDSSSYERVEVIKGPAGVLYGSHNIGGIVNRVSKMPQDRQRTVVQANFSAGWDEYIRGMIDTTGPIGKSGLAYRFVIADREGERSWGGTDDRATIMATLRQSFGKKNQTRVWGRFLYFDAAVNRDQGANFVDKNFEYPGFFSGNNRDYYNWPLDALSVSYTRNFELGFETSFSALNVDWSLRVLGRSNDSDGDKSPSYSNGTIRALNSQGQVIGTNSTLAWDDPAVADWRATLIGRSFAGFSKQNGAFVDLVGRFKLGPTEHTAVASADIGDSSTERIFRFWNAKNPSAPAVYANSYSLIPERAIVELEGVSLGTIQAGDTVKYNINAAPRDSQNHSFGFQDNIALWDRRIIGVFGARYDWAESTVTRLSTTTLEELSKTTTETDQWTYKYGLVAEARKGLNIFAHHSTTFLPRTSGSFPNQDGAIDELGLKLDLLNSTLVASASVFKMELTNVVIQVPNPPELGGGTTPQAVGTQKTDGWEVDLAWVPIPGFKALVAYSDLTSLNANGIPFRGVPQKPTYSVFAKYTIQEGPFKNFGFGLDYKHRGIRTGDTAGTFWLPEINEWGATASYSLKGWSIQLNVRNLTDEDDILTSVSSAASIQPQYPRTYRFTLTRRF